MAGTAEGIGVPRFGAFYRYNEAQTSNLEVSDAGVTTMTQTNATTTATNALGINTTYSGTLASGYQQGVRVNLQVGGTSTGGFNDAQFNAFGADVTVNGTHTGGIGGLYVYMAEGTATLTSAQVYGAHIDITEMGATDYLSCLTLDKHNTTKGTTVDAFINCQLQGSGTGTSLINMQGPAKPTYFLTAHEDMTAGFIENVQPAAATAAFALDVAIGGTKYRIPILTAT